jgi:hypothetical protein
MIRPQHDADSVYLRLLLAGHQPPSPVKMAGHGAAAVGPGEHSSKSHAIWCGCIA